MKKNNPYKYKSPKERKKKQDGSGQKKEKKKKTPRSALKKVAELMNGVLE